MKVVLVAGLSLEVPSFYVQIPMKMEENAVCLFVVVVFIQLKDSTGC